MLTPHSIDDRIHRSALPLATIGENGQPPVSRLKTARHARAMVAELIKADEERVRVDTKIKGSIDGNPPYSRTKLKTRGEAWRTNVNWGESKSQVSAALVPYYDLFAGAPYFCEVATGYGESQEDQMDWSRIITKEVDYTLREWLGFDYNTWAMLFDYVTYGRGFVMFPDDQDFRFQHISRFRIKVPNGTLASVEDLEVCVIRDAMMVHKLWGYIKDAETAQAAGWNRSAVLDAIRHAMPKTSGSTTADFEFWQQELKDHDLYEGLRSDTCQIAHVLVREYSGKVSHFIVMEPGQRQVGDSTGKVKDFDEFLFKRHNRYEDFSEVLAPFFLEVLDGSWNGAAGLGKEIYAAFEAKNRLRCHEVDLAIMRASLILQARTANALASAQLVQMGPLSIVPADFEVQQSAVMGDVDSLIKVNMDLDTMISNNTGIYRQKADKPQGNPRTAEEVRLQYMNQAMLGSSAVNRFYNQLDRLYYEIYRRLAKIELSGSGEGVKMAREFRRRCSEQGVPKEALKECRYVRAYRNIGNGSPFLRQQNLMGIYQMTYPALPESGKENLAQDAIAAFSNHTLVDRYFPKAERAKLPTDQQHQAMLENAAMKIGAPVTWTPTQNNVAHLRTHLQAGAQAFEALSQGGNPMEILDYTDRIGQHSAIHLNVLRGDTSREQDFKVLEEQWKQLAALNDKLRKDIQSSMNQGKKSAGMMQQAQSVQQGMDPQTQLKAAETQAKIQMQEQKTASALQQKQQKHEQALAIADASAAAQIRLARQKQEAT